MNYSEFLTIAKDTNASEKSLRLWHHIYLWVIEHGYADTADTPEFVRYVCSFRQLTVGSINSHLRQMSKSGLLSRYILRRRLPPEIREELLNPIANFFFGADSLPSSFVRYCLPGQKCSLEFKSPERAQEKMRARVSEIRKSKQ